MSKNAVIRNLALLISLASLSACTGMQESSTPQSGASAGTETATVTPTEAVGTTAPPATEGTESSVTATPIETPVAPTPAPINPAIVALLDNAHANEKAGRLPTAGAALERALRIEPRNPVLWQELAMLKLKKGDYVQAENCAARSNSWAGTNKLLLAKNWHIISDARSLRGDNQGARAALARAKSFEELAATVPTH